MMSEVSNLSYIILFKLKQRWQLYDGDTLVGSFAECYGGIVGYMWAIEDL